jgi:hypothetical protein
VSRALFRISTVCCLRVAVVRSRICAAHLVRAFSRAVHAHHRMSFSHGQTSGRACFPCAPSHVTCALFAPMALVVIVLFVCLVRALFTYCHACCSHALSHVVLRVSRVPFTRVVRLVARISHVNHVCRATSAHDNKLFSLMNLITLISQVVYFR